MRHSIRCLRLTAGALVVLGSLTAVGACDRLLEVDLPGRVPASSLDDPSRAPLLVQSAIADFECAFGNYVAATGLFTDELLSATGAGGVVAWENRLITKAGGGWARSTCGTGVVFSYDLGVYTPLSTARFQADDAFKRIEAFPDDKVPGKTALLAAAAAYAGYAYVLFGESFCEAAFDAGPALAPTEILLLAERRFTTALELAELGRDANLLSLARAGRARARLDLSKNAEAAADARLVPEGYVHNSTYSATNNRRQNPLYAQNQRQRVTSVDPRFRDLKVGGMPDSRVRVTDANRAGDDGFTRLWVQTKYISEANPIVLASWKEAQLILAEAEGGGAAIEAINRLRLKAGLPVFSGGSPDAILREVHEERKRELFLDGHRLGDMLRLGIPLDKGVTPKGQTYGETTCLPLPQVEIDNNPSIRK